MSVNVEKFLQNIRKTSKNQWKIIKKYRKKCKKTVKKS